MAPAHAGRLHWPRMSAWIFCACCRRATATQIPSLSSAVRMVDAGWLGRKSGRGFYTLRELNRRGCVHQPAAWGARKSETHSVKLRVGQFAVNVNRVIARRSFDLDAGDRPSESHSWRCGWTRLSCPLGWPESVKRPPGREQRQAAISFSNSVWPSRKPQRRAQVVELLRLHALSPGGSPGE